MSTTGTDVEHDLVHVGDERLGVIHSGGRYLLGFGRNYYGIWEQGAPDGPAHRFPPTEKGRHAAWERYVQLEPSAEEAHAADIVPDETMESAKRGWTRRRLITVGAVVAVVILAVVLTQINKSGKPTVAAVGQVGNTAHLDISGGTTASEDLTQKAFKFIGFGSLFPKVQATWTGTSATLQISVSIPSLGPNETQQIPDRDVTITIQQQGKEAQFRSAHSECTLTFTTLEEHGIGGTLACTGIPGPEPSSTTIDAKGTFAAKS